MAALGVSCRHAALPAALTARNRRPRRAEHGGRGRWVMCPSARPARAPPAEEGPTALSPVDSPSEVAATTKGARLHWPLHRAAHNSCFTAKQIKGLKRKIKCSMTNNIRNLQVSQDYDQIWEERTG